MEENLVKRAVDALQAYHATLKGKGKPRLIDDDPLVSLIIALKKIPNHTNRPHRIPLSHTLYPLADTEMCLITKDNKKDVKSFLEEKKIHGVTKVIPIAKLKTNYKSYESKRRLSSSYDVFLTDKRLYHMLPRLLGKKFFEKKKFPFPVDLQKKDLGLEMSRARDASYLHLGLGSCSSVPIGRVGFPGCHLVENICEAVKVVASRIPRGWKNIQSIHIKTVDSIALPIFNSLPPDPLFVPGIGEEAPPVKKVKLEESPMAADEVDDEDDRIARKSSQVKGEKRKRMSVGGMSTAKLSAKKVRGSTVINTSRIKGLRASRRRTLN